MGRNGAGGRFHFMAASVASHREGMFLLPFLKSVSDSEGVSEAKDADMTVDRMLPDPKGAPTDCWSS